MQLKVEIENISVFLQPDASKASVYPEYLQLNIQKIRVSNKADERLYVRNSQAKVLVENYAVDLEGISIFNQFIDKVGQKHSYKLTNNLDISLSTDLIANPHYYIKLYGDNFKNGLRVSCLLSPFFMRINRDDFNFIMKCLNWNITHNDGADDILFDIPKQKES